MAAIRAGKHVLTEKPFAANAEEARRVHEIAQRSDRIVFEGFHFAYHPIFARLLELIGDGTVGDLTQFHVAMEMPSPGSRRSALVVAAGRIHLPDFLHTNDDDRLIITTDDGEQVEHRGALSTYTYQLHAFTNAIRRGRRHLTTTADSVATMELVDDCHRMAGLRPRDSSWTDAALGAETP